MIEHLPVSQSVSLKQLDAENEALINEYFSSEKVDEAAEHCLRLFGSKAMKSTYEDHKYKKRTDIKIDEDDEYTLDPSSLSYAARKLKWRHCIIKELDRINRGLFQWNIGSMFKFHEDNNAE
ncbi:unnamed protein product [Heterobilharzia americana]|nr:unnamed protein product [Heterobilharzia americana]